MESRDQTRLIIGRGNGTKVSMRILTLAVSLLLFADVSAQQMFPIPESHTYQFTRKQLSSMESVKNDPEELAALFKTGDRHIEDLIQALDDPDRDISIRAQTVIRYLGNERGMRKLIEWYDKRPTEVPIAGPVPLPLSEWDYEFINIFLLPKSPDMWREIGVRYIYALAIDDSDRSQRVLEAVVKNGSAASLDGFVGRAISQVPMAKRGELIGRRKDLARLVLENAFFVSQWDKKYTTARLLGFNGSKDKALIEVYINRGPLAEEWHHVVIRKRDSGWKFFSITEVGLS